MRWCYGITVSPSRIQTCLQRTLQSLANAGFENPFLFIDGEPGSADHINLRKTYRCERSWIYQNWVLGMNEMVIRHPDCDRYVMFQDDILASAGLREYLEKCEYTPKTYYNLITYPNQHPRCPSPDFQGWTFSTQQGQGAQGLMFDIEVLEMLLTSKSFYRRRYDTSLDTRGRWKGRRNIDGGIVDAMKVVGVREMIHFPSLLSHDVDESSAIGNKRQPDIPSWLGEQFDCRTLLRQELSTGSYNG